MEEIEYEVTRNSSVDGDELDRYAVYRLLLLSFEKDVRSGDMEFDELIDIEKVAADICRPFIRLSSLDLRLSVNGEMWRKPPAPKKAHLFMRFSGSLLCSSSCYSAGSGPTPQRSS